MADEFPRFPKITVVLSEHEGKPVAMIALVRRALQKAGHLDAARRFSDEAMAGEADDIVPTARRYVHVE